jgi:hypothetical protein
MSLFHPTRPERLLRRRAVFVLAAFCVGIVYPYFLHIAKAHAATPQRVLVRFDRMLISTPTTGTVCMQPATTSANVKTWTVTFPASYTVSGTGSNWQTANISTTNLAWPTGGTAWPNATSATATISTQTVTWTNASVQTMNAGTLYCYNWTNTAALSIKSSSGQDLAGTVATQDNGAATIDSGNFATAALAASPGDQITVTATVPQTFNFAISANTDALGTLATGSNTASPTPRTATVNTNAKNGWYVWAKDANTGLNSSSASYTIASTTPGSNSTLTPGTEGYNMGVTSTQTSGTGTITVAAPFVGGSTGKGGGLDTTLRTVASSSGTANNAVLTLTNNADIQGTTPAATDYTDIETFTAAGLF